MSMLKKMAALAVGWALAGCLVAAEHPEAAGTAAGAPAQASGPLDGKVFVGEIGKVGEAKGDKDDFVFQKGTFASTACTALGFREAPYVATTAGDSISFTSNPKSAKNESMAWKGVVKGDKIEGTASHRMEKGQTEYWFKGTLKAAEKKSSEHPKKSEHPASEPPKSEHPTSEHPK